MKTSPSLLSQLNGAPGIDEAVPEPHIGPSWVRGRFTRGFFIAAALLGVAGALALPRLAQRSHSCACRSQRAALTASPTPPVLTEQQRLQAEDLRLTQELRAYDRTAQQGHGCHMGYVRLRLAQLRVREQLTECPRARAYIRREINQLESWQAEAMGSTAAADSIE